MIIKMVHCNKICFILHFIIVLQKKSAIIPSYILEIDLISTISYHNLNTSPAHNMTEEGKKKSKFSFSKFDVWKGIA